ncbi:MAG: hypothetical protein AMXMBFR33_62510 [Candidatus Xenobia bacterium]
MLLMLTASALASLAPQALEQRSRLGFLLSNETRSRADRVAAELALTDMPPVLEQRLSEALGDAGQSAPTRLYAGVAFLKRRDRALDAYDRRLADAKLGQEMLEEYLEQASFYLQQAGGGPAGAALETPASPPWELEESATSMKVLRWLEIPNAQMSRARLTLLREAASQDLRTAYLEYDRVERARADFQQSSLAWVDYVHTLTQTVSALKDGQILALPGGNPHPAPSF